VIELDASARDWLAIKGYDPLFGARPLARVIQEHIKPLAEELLFGKLARWRRRVYAEKDAEKLSSPSSHVHRHRRPSPRKPSWSNNRARRQAACG
jgi:ATP-dependent Clp protease ATP-binding subunit ClpA